MASSVLFKLHSIAVQNAQNIKYHHTNLSFVQYWQHRNRLRLCSGLQEKLQPFFKANQARSSIIKS